MLKLLEQVAGDDSLEFNAPDRVNVKPTGSEQTWAEVETKTPESLKVTLAGPREAIDVDQLTDLKMNEPVDLSDEKFARVTLNLTELKHVRSRKLRSFLKSHLQRTVQ
jgi:excinuclease ABC subunit A